MKMKDNNHPILDVMLNHNMEAWNDAAPHVEYCIINSLAPGEFDFSLKLVNFKLISMINVLSIFCEIAIRWIPKHLTDY